MVIHVRDTVEFGGIKNSTRYRWKFLGADSGRQQARPVDRIIGEIEHRSFATEISFALIPPGVGNVDRKKEYSSLYKTNSLSSSPVPFGHRANRTDSFFSPPSSSQLYLHPRVHGMKLFKVIFPITSVPLADKYPSLVTRVQRCETTQRRWRKLPAKIESEIISSLSSFSVGREKGEDRGGEGKKKKEKKKKGIALVNIGPA